MTKQYGLGRSRVSPPDPRDHTFAMYAQLPAKLPETLYPPLDTVVYDQKATPKCVGFSGSAIRTFQERNDEKHVVLFDADELYARCKEQDGDPNGDGTEVRVAASILKKRGALVASSPNENEVGQFRAAAAYTRLSSLDEVKAAILYTGACWFGTSWFQSWFEPDASGNLPSGDRIVGGHAYSIVGWDDTRETKLGTGACLVLNNWGDSWGNGGRAWMPYELIDFNDQNFEAWQIIDTLNDYPTASKPTPEGASKFSLFTWFENLIKSLFGNSK